MIVHPPLYLLRAPENCWRCRRPIEVLALASQRIEIPEDEVEFDDLESLNVLVYVTELPPPVLALLQGYSAHYRHGFSRAAGGRYLANHCPHCKALQGDNFLHHADGPFSPYDERAAQAICLEQLPVSEPMFIAAEDFRTTDAQTILLHARRDETV